MIKCPSCLATSPSPSPPLRRSSSPQRQSQTQSPPSTSAQAGRIILPRPPTSISPSTITQPSATKPPSTQLNATKPPSTTTSPSKSKCPIQVKLPACPACTTPFPSLPPSTPPEQLSLFDPIWGWCTTSPSILPSASTADSLGPSSAGLALLASAVSVAGAGADALGGRKGEVGVEGDGGLQEGTKSNHETEKSISGTNRGGPVSRRGMSSKDEAKKSRWHPYM